MNCPISTFLKNICSSNYNNQLDHKILRELDTISKRVLKCLESINEQLLPDTITPIDLQTLIKDTIQSDLKKISYSKKLENHIRFRNNFQGIDQEIHMTQLFTIAILDIYSVMLLHKNLGISKSKLKGLIYLNMYSGSANMDKLPSSVIWDALDEENNTLNIDMLLKQIKNSSEISDSGAPVCSFYDSDYKVEWIDTIWDFLEKSFLPKLATKYKNAHDYTTLFYSGNDKNSS